MLVFYGRQFARFIGQGDDTMIWNDDILFIHAPKTAGMSMTTMLTEGLEGKVYVTGHETTETRGDLTLIPGKRHETLAQAVDVLKSYGRSLSDFKAIFSVMREPYRLEISRYNYLRLNHPWDQGHAQTIALESDFKGYLRDSPFFGYSPPRLDLFYHIDNTIPENAIFLKHEFLNQDIVDHVLPFLKPGVKLPRENVTGDSVYEKYYDDEAEELCYRRHRWFFDKGFYRRRKRRAEEESIVQLAGESVIRSKVVPLLRRRWRLFRFRMGNGQPRDLENQH